jgi:xanthine/uracil/vitamin C permease (AzgA family)
MLAGVTTFLTMAYIIFVQPAVLSGVFRLCAKPNGLAQIQASSGSGPSESEGAVAVLTAPRRNAGIRQPSASQK